MNVWSVGIIFQFLPFLFSFYPMPLTSLISRTMQLQSCQGFWILAPKPFSMVRKMYGGSINCLTLPESALGSAKWAIGFPGAVLPASSRHVECHVTIMV